jgi:uncharacterized protein YndB with AHSA1/START domain
LKTRTSSDIGKETEMYTVRQSIFIKAPQETVFDMIADPDRAAEWQTALQRTDAGGARRLSRGTSVADSRNWLGQSLESRYEVVESAPPDRLHLRVAAGPVPFDFIWTLESVDGGTRLTGEGQGQWSGRQGEGIAARTADHNLAADLAILRALIEQ